MRKLTALLLSALMLIGMCTPALAAVELEDAPFTLEEITKINDPRSVLEKYSTLRIDEQTMTASGEPFGFAHYQFSLTADGQVLSNVHLREGDVEVFANFSVADDMPGACSGAATTARSCTACPPGSMSSSPLTPWAWSGASRP